MIFLPLLQFAALTSEDVWAAAAVFEELRLLFPIRVRRDGGVGGGWKKKDSKYRGRLNHYFWLEHLQFKSREVLFSFFCSFLRLHDL